MAKLTVTRAKELAQRAHGERRDKLGYQEFDHIERVANAVSLEARPIAYLHDAVEDGLISFRTAWSEMDDDQFYALLLVTREPANGTYMDYVRAIRDAAQIGGGNTAGKIALEIKRADLHDNMTRPSPESMTGMREPGGRYVRAAALLDNVALDC